MNVKIEPGKYITACHLIGESKDNKICVIDRNDFTIIYTGLPFDGTTVTEVLKKFYEIKGTKFDPQNEPIIRIKKVNPIFNYSRYSHAVIAAKINYDEGTVSYGWSVSVKEDGFNKHIGVTIANERLEKNPITIPYNPLIGITKNVMISGTAPQPLQSVLHSCKIKLTTHE